MNASGWIQLIAFCIGLFLITKPMGIYLVQVLDAKGRTWLDWFIKPFEKLTYRVLGVNPEKEHDWKRYTIAMLVFSLVSALFTYAILRLQHLLPLNPQKFGALTPDLSKHSTSFHVSPRPATILPSARYTEDFNLSARPPALELCRCPILRLIGQNSIARRTQAACRGGRL